MLSLLSKSSRLYASAVRPISGHFAAHRYSIRGLSGEALAEILSISPKAESTLNKSHRADESSKVARQNIFLKADRTNPAVQHFRSILKSEGLLSRSDYYEYLSEKSQAKNLSVADFEQLIIFTVYDVVFHTRDSLLPIVLYLTSLVEEQGFKVTGPMYVCMLEACSRSSNIGYAQTVLKKMQSKNVKPSFRVFAVVVQLYAFTGGMEKANSLLEKCRDNLTPEELGAVYSRYVFGLSCRYSKRGVLQNERQAIRQAILNVYSMAKEQPLEFFQPIFSSAMLGGLSEIGSSELAAKFLRKAEAQYGFKVTEDAYFKLIRPFARQEAWSDAIALFTELQKTGLPITKNGLWATMMHAFIATKNEDAFWNATKETLAHGKSVLCKDGKVALAKFFGKTFSLSLHEFLTLCEKNGLPSGDKSAMLVLLRALAEGYLLLRNYEANHSVNLLIKLYTAQEGQPATV